MATVVKLPKLGPNMEEGQIVQWLVNIGDPVKKGQPLFEMMTDKTTIEVESTMDGYLLKTLVECDEDYDIGTPICIIGEKGENAEGLV
ncbi:MAG: biotin/lipoyl-containing protein [Christensenellales bacterium]